MCMDVHPNPGPSTSETHTLDIFHLNTRSVRNKLDHLSDMVDSYHILCFSETHLDNSVDSSNLLIEGFDESIRKDRTQHGGGVMIYLSNLLKYKRRLDLESQHLETIWVEIKFSSHDILICCLYRSDFNTTQLSFIDEIQTSIETALDYSPFAILTGDINIDFTNLTNIQLRDCLSLFNLSNIIKEPTRVVGDSKTVIEPVIVSDACSVLDSGTITVEPFISDHKATYVSIKSSVSFTNSYYREVWNYKHADFEKLNNLISQYCWDSVINDSTSVDQASLNFTNSYIDLCKTCIPCKRVLIRPSDKPWFSSELRYNIRLRDRLRQKALKTNLVNDKLIFKKQRNRVNNMKKYAKENYINNFEDTILSSENSTKTFWKIMGQFVGKQAITNPIPPLYTSNNNYVFSDEEKANILNDYFCSISTIDDSGTSLPIFNEKNQFLVVKLNNQRYRCYRCIKLT